MRDAVRNLSARRRPAPSDLGPETGQGFRDYLDYAVEAEALGYRSSFLVEHHFTGWNQVSATLMLQTALAMRTTTLRLGTAVIVLPWHNPVLLAEQAATLDLISGGRLDFGIGKGYRHNEFAGFRIPPEEAEPRFEESVEVMTKAFVSRERFSHRGKFWQFDDIVVEPPPAQQPHPPFWVAAGSEASIRRAAQARLQPDPRPICLARAARPAHRALPRRARGQRPAFDPMQVAVARQLYVANDKADAAAALRARRRAYTKRTVEVSRAPGGKAGSHVLSYAGDAAARPRRTRSTARPTRSARRSKRCSAGRRRIRHADAARRPGAVAALRARDHAGVRRQRAPEATASASEARPA